jgi:hypothetical protein
MDPVPSPFWVLQVAALEEVSVYLVLKQEDLGRTNFLLSWYDADCIQIMSNNFSIVAPVFIAAVTFLPNRFLATIGRCTYRHTLMSTIYEERRSGGLRCHDMHTKLYKDWFTHSKVERGNTQIHRQHGDHISILNFFKVRKVGYIKIL